RVREGAGQAACQSDLDRRLRVPAGVGDRAVARRARAAAPRGAARARPRVTAVALVLGIVIAAGAVLLVAWPFLREPAAADARLRAPDAEADRRLELIEERDRVLAALKELEFDHRTGKIGDEDYRSQIGPLRRSAAAALR